MVHSHHQRLATDLVVSPPYVLLRPNRILPPLCGRPFIVYGIGECRKIASRDSISVTATSCRRIKTAVADICGLCFRRPTKAGCWSKYIYGIVPMMLCMAVLGAGLNGAIGGIGNDCACSAFIKASDSDSHGGNPRLAGNCRSETLRLGGKKWALRVARPCVKASELRRTPPRDTIINAFQSIGSFSLFPSCKKQKGRIVANFPSRSR